MLVYVMGAVMVIGLIAMIGGLVDLSIQVFKHNRWNWDSVGIVIMGAFALLVATNLFNFCRHWIY
jgi:hypothetical protein